ncbi:23S rRNA (uracil(1939)-C(5))-methyltransferase RlmD [Roseburia sp. 499]|uniref:23S rRNA (uracil(1939)-C(5))-methyltransferase RlmD n=1 Tax=Roseburia sp. 499 TaxID=1261634 RepID=UPI0009515833|nr:23S rRNA (uracil(1939)-C(5))-methyltransferase RlmD [Roseburia sp. 499]WVK70135.1 23S rRNA (uracil(1939)-C(5))-methyltransferase RlmD [Roseburia sp. 499]
MSGKRKDIRLQKDMELELTIEDMGVDGEGIGKAEGVTLFVKDAVLGDVVRVKIMKMKKNYGYARIMEILDPSPYRVEPKCTYHRQCGGCQIQAVDYAQQLRFKENKVRNNLKRIGGFAVKEADGSGEGITVNPVIGMDEPYFYRNKAQFPIGTDKNGNIVTGFYASRSHNIIPNRKCYLGAEINEKILDIVISFMKEYHIPAYDETTGKGLVRHVLIRFGFTTKEIMVCLVVNGRKLPHAEKLVERLTELEGMTSITLNVNEKNTNVILGEEIISLWGQDYITDYIGGIKYQISPLSFYQVNPVQTEKLYGTALEYAGLTGKETVWDLYCGIGTISLFLAQKAKQVYGVEIVPPAIEDAKNNAKINGIENVEFFVGKAEEVLPEFYEKGMTEKNREDMLHPDVIVVDPPRKGCDEKCLETIVKMKPERVVYVSCDSATLARDLKYLCEQGYEVKKVQPVDMFPHTGHVETVVLMSRKDK